MASVLLFGVLVYASAWKRRWFTIICIHLSPSTLFTFKSDPFFIVFAFSFVFFVLFNISCIKDRSLNIPIRLSALNFEGARFFSCLVTNKNSVCMLLCDFFFSSICTALNLRICGRQYFEHIRKSLLPERIGLFFCCFSHKKCSAPHKYDFSSLYCLRC